MIFTNKNVAKLLSKIKQLEERVAILESNNREANCMCKNKEPDGEYTIVKRVREA